jgi:hypothetical protein
MREKKLQQALVDILGELTGIDFDDLSKVERHIQRTAADALGIELNEPDRCIICGKSECLGDHA